MPEDYLSTEDAATFMEEIMKRTPAPYWLPLLQEIKAGNKHSNEHDDEAILDRLLDSFPDGETMNRMYGILKKAPTNDMIILASEVSKVLQKLSGRTDGDIPDKTLVAEVLLYQMGHELITLRPQRENAHNN